MSIATPSPEAQLAIRNALRNIGWREGTSMRWSPSQLTRFLSQSLYCDLPALYCCYVDDDSCLQKIELVAVGQLEKINLREAIIAARAKNFGATGIVLGFSDVQDEPVPVTEIKKLKLLAQNLEDLGVTLIELIRLSGSAVDRIRLA